MNDALLGNRNTSISKFLPKKRNSISWKTTRNCRDLHEKKIPDVQNLEDETKWDLNVSLGLVSFICGHIGTLYDDDEQSC